MRALSPIYLLELWDRGRGRHPVDRALVVLAFACPERAWDELCELPIGERNRLLLLTRAANFGPRLDIVTSCPDCSAKLEFEFEFPLANFAAMTVAEVEGQLADGVVLRVRLPSSSDLAAIAGVAEPNRAARVLLSRCVLAATRDGEVVHLDPDLLAAGFSQLVEDRDPLSSITFPVACQDCSARWRAVLDPIDYFWRELGQRVTALVREVHTLARAYGWTEGEVLRLSAARRQLYLEQVGA